MNLKNPGACYCGAYGGGVHTRSSLCAPKPKRCQFGFAPNAMLDHETQCTLPNGHDGEHKLSRNVETSSEDK